MKKRTNTNTLAKNVSSDKGVMTDIAPADNLTDFNAPLIDQEANLIDVAVATDAGEPENLLAEAQLLNVAAETISTEAPQIDDAPPIISQRNVGEAKSQTHGSEARDFLDPVDLSLQATDADKRGEDPENNRLAEEDAVIGNDDSFINFLADTPETIPPETFVTLDQIGRDTTPGDGFKTDPNPQMHFCGTGEVGGEIYISVNGGAINIDEITTVNQNGDWEAYLDVTEARNYNVSISILDGDGNSASVSNILDVVFQEIF